MRNPPPLIPCQRPNIFTPAGGGAPVLKNRASDVTTLPLGIFQLTMNFIDLSPVLSLWGRFLAQASECSSRTSFMASTKCGTHANLPPHPVILIAACSPRPNSTNFARPLAPRASSAPRANYRPTSATASPTFACCPAQSCLPRTTEQVQAVVRFCARHKIPFVSRGAGTGLSGGALPAAGGIVISLARMNRILEVDIANRCVVVEPGVINAQVTQRVSPHGYFYAPDPSSQSVCTIGGNVAENSGGAHCLKYGFTVTHTLALEVVLPSGELAHFGSPALDAPGYDLAGVFVGSEGTLGVATKITLRIVRRPEVVQTLLAAFLSPSSPARPSATSSPPACCPRRSRSWTRSPSRPPKPPSTRTIPCAAACCSSSSTAPCDEVDALMREVRAIAASNGASEIRLAQSDAERALIWKGRKAAFAAMGRISPNYIVQDGVIPRTALPRVLADIERMSSAVNLRVANVFHAGDGNLHPLVLYDRSIPGQEEIALDLSYRILNLCVDNGGSITGEHGVGKEKQQALGYMFSEPDLDTMQLVRCAFDPENLSNPDKVFPAHAPLRRQTRPLHAASSRNGRRGGDLLMAAASALTTHGGRPRAARCDRRRRRHAQSAGDTIQRRARQALSRSQRFSASPISMASPSYRRAAERKLGWGNPVAPEIDLSLARMNAVREHAWQDLTCTVDAGCTWATMQESNSRATARWWRSIRSGPSRATVGGIVADQRQRRAAPALRRPARSHHRHDRRSRRRHHREDRRQGREECRRLRPA